MAEKLGFNFGFVWDNSIDLDRFDIRTKISEDIYYFANDMENVSSIFSYFFLKKYYITDYKIQKNHGFKLHSKIRTFDEIKSPPFENEWGWYSTDIPPYYWLKDCKKEEFLCIVRDIYNNKFIFSSDYQQIFDNVNVINEKINNFIALHIRGGDIVYSSLRKHAGRKVLEERFFPYEIALEIIKRHTNANVKIIIFGQDVKSNMKLLNYIIENKILPKNKIFTVDEFINQTFNIFERTFFEMNLMSHALKIYTPGIQAQKSAFSQCAMMIAGRKNIISYHEIFSLKQQYQIIKSNLGLLGLDSLYDSMAYFQLYKLSRILNLTLDLSLNYIKKAMELDQDNDAWGIHYIYCCFLLGDLEAIETFLKVLLDSNKLNNLLQTFIISKSMRIYKEQEDCFISFRSTKIYPMINYVGIWLNYHYGEFVRMYKMYKNYQKYFNDLEVDTQCFFSCYQKKDLISNSAVLIVKNHLSYKLGKILLECKNLKDFVEIPIIIKYFLWESKNEKAYFKSFLFEIEKLDDYNQSCSIRNYLSYQLGKLIIESFKGWYKGYLLLLPYRAFILYRKIKKDKR
ncbi:hypothetical protein BSN48_08695 [Campylobacter jejuni]|nr:hypothetical protein [Campylobacter jejuni]